MPFLPLNKGQRWGGHRREDGPCLLPGEGWGDHAQVQVEIEGENEEQP